MSDAVLVALVTGICTLAASYLAHKVSADREDRRRVTDVSREKAAERVKELYKPLIQILERCSPPDEFDIDSDTLNKVFKLIDDKELLASPDLLYIYWRFYREFYESSGQIDGDLAWKLYGLIRDEYEELKCLLGYGDILKKDDLLKKCSRRIKKFFGDSYRKLRRTRLFRRAKRRYRVLKDK